MAGRRGGSPLTGSPWLSPACSASAGYTLSSDPMPSQSTLKYASRGAETAERMRSILRRRGETYMGNPLWTKAEEKLLRDLYGTTSYANISRILKRRSYYAVRGKAQALGLQKKRHVWTGAEIARLRRLYLHASSWQEIQSGFAWAAPEDIRKVAARHGIRRPRHKFKPTGIPVIDQIRERAYELGYTMVDLDKLARTRAYFSSAEWHNSGVRMRAIAKAVAALDGEVAAVWH